jgi:hypothetical protein
MQLGKLKLLKKTARIKQGSPHLNSHVTEESFDNVTTGRHYASSKPMNPSKFK